MDFPEELFYTEEHEWASMNEAETIATIGITDFAQSELGDIVFLELPAEGGEVEAGDAVGTIEAVKTVADLYAPLSGKVIRVNSILEDEPELINDDPYGKGWILQIEISDSSEVNNLLQANDYKKHTE